ncbi:MAG: hypothetical protein ACI9ZD_000615 [Paracoccaceae bacterium]
MDYETLNEQLFAAHAENDKTKLVALYRLAGEMMISHNDINAASFYLTHAYIFALDVGDKAAPEIHKMLVGFGREE